MYLSLSPIGVSIFKTHETMNPMSTFSSIQGPLVRSYEHLLGSHENGSGPRPIEDGGGPAGIKGYGQLGFMFRVVGLL